ncbi:SH3 domain-containing protein [Azorhizobium doebereinerae]|uniref:SH3 domain-containing protein n=1 Tax=Azorhizobium doebereinerae TaxID=281091 RepID=UPI000A060015|nr:SH3 domain-containing protein [Azorhizobium doebereinerae]
MWKTSVAAAILAACASTAGAGAAAAATGAVAVSNVNLRAGPSTAYPAVTVVPAAAPIVTYGCVAGYSWCDISYGPYRGWVAAAYIQVVYQGAPVVLSAPVAPRVGVVVVGFDRTYWDRYYTAYPWYGRWGAYPPYGAPRATAHGAAVSCGGGTCTGVRATTGYYGGSTAQVRQCGGGECSSTRTTVGPNGGVATRTRSFER